MKTTLENLLMFLGTREEVEHADSIDKCFYFAWDTGEIWLGNKHGSKTKYGGSRNTLSEVDIRKIVNSENRIAMSQVNNTANEIANEQKSFILNINDKIRQVVAKVDTINDNTTQYVKDRVESVLEGMQTNFYTKDNINELLSRYVLLSDYNNDKAKLVTKDEMNQSVLLPQTGDYLYRNLTRLNGYYFCTKDYTSATYNFYLGTIYSISRGVVTELGSSGGGGGDASTRINKFLVSNSDYILKQYGEPLSTTTQFIYNIVNGKYATSAGIYYDNELISVDIDLTSTTDKTKVINMSEMNSTAGRHTFKLSILSKNGETISSSVNLDIVRPIYYGVFDDTVPSLSSLAKAQLKLDPTGRYNVSTTSGYQYIWFVYPINGNDGMIVDDIRSNGFTIPTISFVNNDYRYLRSANEVNIGTITFTIEGSSNASFK